MKHRVKIFLAVFFLALMHVLPIKAQQAFYIYRNDGVINTFFTTEIDSMTYSRIDTDSILHEEYVVHEVYTPDSTYRIPIELIDSVGFVTPETKYKSGVVVLEGEIRSYIQSRDSLSLIFNADIPSTLLPRKGDKLVSTVGDEILESAFVGQVLDVYSVLDGWKVTCDAIDLTEVFECYYGIIKKDAEPLSISKTRGVNDGFYGTGTRRFSPGKLSCDLFNNYDFEASYEVDDELSFFVDKRQLTVSLTPTIDYNAFVIINKEYGVNVSVTAIGNYTLEEFLALSGGVQFGGDVSLLEKAIPIPEALVDIYFEFGIFNTMRGKISLEQNWTQKYRHIFHWEWSSKNHETLKNTNELKPISSSHTGEIALNGKWSTGLYGKTGVAFIATSSLDIAEIGLRAEAGLACEGTYVPYKKDSEYAKKSTDLYNQIKDRDVSSYWYYGLSGEAKLFKWSISHEVPNFGGFPLNKKGIIACVKDVPLFSDTKITKEADGTFFATAKAEGIVHKTDLGFALINQNNSDDATYTYTANDYQGPSCEMYATFYNKSQNDRYILYPLVKYMGMELIAEPSAENADITFKKAEITNIEAEPKYNADGEYLFTWYTTQFKYVVQIVGSALIDYVQPIIYDNGAWTYNGGKTKVPGDGMFSVTTTLNYDNDANMNWDIGYSITLKDGSIIYSTNTLHWGGTPEAPTISIGEDAISNDSKSRSAIKRLDEKYKCPTLGELVIEEINKIPL